MSAPSPLVAELRGVVGESEVVTDRDEIGRSLRDNSWLSPVLSAHISDLTDTGGSAMNVDALVRPHDVDELTRCISRCVEHDTPLTMLGAGTSNLGQTVPLDGGVVISTRHLNGVSTPERGRITAQAGATAGKVDEIARPAGQMIPVMTTTYASATVAGWVCGGHVGLGSTTWGSIWDGNVLGASILTVEAEPRTIVLDEHTVEPVLHAYGTTGVVTDVTLRLVPACEWVELVITFPDFEAAVAHVHELSGRADLRTRVASAQEPDLTPAFTPLADLIGPDDALVLVIVAEDDAAEVVRLAEDAGGRVTPWRGMGADHRPTLGYMVYGHRMLWVKRIAPEGAFLNCYLDPASPLDHLRQFKAAMGDAVLVELKYLRSQWIRERYGFPGPGVLGAPLVCIVDGREQLPDVLACCDDLQIRYQNPHSFRLEDQGLFADPSVLHRFKAEVDPHGLLNPGKLGSGADDAATDETTGTGGASR